MERHIFVFLVLLLIGCDAPKTDRVSNTDQYLIPATAEEILKNVKNTDARVVLVNVWATWCQPCVEEFPDLMAVYQQYKEQGVKLVFISADFEGQADGAIAFLKAQGVDFPSYLKLRSDRAFINTLDPNWSGAIPATWLYDSEGNKRYFWLGKTSREQFEKKIRDVLMEGDQQSGPPSFLKARGET